MARPTWEELSRRALDAKARGLPPPITTMLARHGPGPGGRTCATCVSLVKQAADRGPSYYLKCRKHGATHGAGTDWRMRWPACGAYEHRPAPETTAARQAP